MTLSFSLHAEDIAFTGEPEIRLAASHVYAVYTMPHWRSQVIQLEPGSCSVREVALNDVHGSGIQTILKQSAANGIELTYRINRYSQRPFLLLRLSISNQSRQPLNLHELILLQVSAGNLRVAPEDQGLNFFKVGWHGWAYSGLRQARERERHNWISYLTRSQYHNPTTRFFHKPGEFSSEGWAILANERLALIVGMVSMADQFGQVEATCQPGQLGLRLVAQADEILLPPGNTFDSEWGYLQTLSMPDADPAREFAMAVGRQMGARQRLDPPPFHWTHWYQFFDDISAEKFLSNLDIIHAVRQQVPFQVAQLDDGYQSAWGDWAQTNSRFPAGLKDLAHRIKQVGFLPGLWMSPFVFQPGSDLNRDHPDWLLRNRRGKPINAGFFYKFFGLALDTTHPAAQDHLAELTKTMSLDWGFGLLKLDFLYAAALPGRRYDPGKTRAQALRLGLDVIRQAVGEETFILGCGCPFGPAIGIVDAMRISPDTAPTWEPFFNWAPWISLLLRREPSPPALRNSLRHVLNLSCLHRRWWWNDPDCLLVRKHDTQLTQAEVRSRVTMVGLSGGLVVDSDDLAGLPSERLNFLSLLSPVLSPGGKPLDLLKQDMPELYHVPAHSTAGDWHLVAVFNWKNCLKDKSISLTSLGLSAGQQFYIFDFWAQRGWVTNNLELAFPEIPAHDCRLLRVSVLNPASMVPQLLGDTLHITQGLEIASLLFEPERLWIQTIDLNRQVQGALWLALPSLPISASCNGASLRVNSLGHNVYHIPLSFYGAGMIELAFRVDPIGDLRELAV